METVIIAPHPDDEIIGCYKYLTQTNPIIIYDGDTDVERRVETQNLRNHADIKVQLFLMAIPPNLLNKDNSSSAIISWPVSGVSQKNVQLFAASTCLLIK